MQDNHFLIMRMSFFFLFQFFIIIAFYFFFVSSILYFFLFICSLILSGKWAAIRGRACNYIASCLLLPLAPRGLSLGESERVLAKEGVKLRGCGIMRIER